MILNLSCGQKKASGLRCGRWRWGETSDGVGQLIPHQPLKEGGAQGVDDAGKVPCTEAARQACVPRWRVVEAETQMYPPSLPRVPLASSWRMVPVPLSHRHGDPGPRHPSHRNGSCPSQEQWLLTQIRPPPRFSRPQAIPGVLAWRRGGRTPECAGHSNAGHEGSPGAQSTLFFVTFNFYSHTPCFCLGLLFLNIIFIFDY